MRMQEDVRTKYFEVPLLTTTLVSPSLSRECHMWHLFTIIATKTTASLVNNMHMGTP
jgi:hypothetical protein